MPEAPDRLVALVQSGRSFQPKELEQICWTVQSFPNLTRTELARTLCEHLKWRTVTGRAKLDACQGREPAPVDFAPRLPKPSPPAPALEMNLAWQLPARQGRSKGQSAPRINALWLTSGSLNAAPKVGMADLWWWLPPAIWPDEEADWLRTVEQALKQGAKKFVLGSPWQVAFFNDAVASNWWDIDQAEAKNAPGQHQAGDKKGNGCWIRVATATKK